MPVSLQERGNGELLEVHLTGRLTAADYEMFLPAVERLVNQHGKIRMLVDMVGFYGWTAGALWQDIKFEIRHFADVDRLAIIGEAKWEQAMVSFCKPFTTAEVRYFDHTQVSKARAWVAGN
jgi:hypothetical protein